MKTRSNMPLFVVECTDVKALSNSQIDLLRCGDYLVKKDASGEHAYKVTFKSDTGMCITYHDASVIETQSYDKIDGVWTYNSEDKTPNLLELQNVEDAPSGTIVNALGLDSNGDLVKGTISGGTKLYQHVITGLKDGSKNVKIQLVSNDGTNYSGLVYVNYSFTIQNLINNCISGSFGSGMSPSPSITSIILGSSVTGGGGTALKVSSIIDGSAITLCDALDTISITDTVTEL